MVDAEADLGAAREPGQPVELGGTDDLVRHQHVADAAIATRTSASRNLPAALPDRAMGDLPVARSAMRSVRRHAAVSLMPWAAGARRRHGDEVPLEGIEIENEELGVSISAGALARLGRRR